MSDTVFIEEARFQCHLGVTPKERAEAQEVIVDVELELDVSAAGASDRINDTVNYTEVWKRISERLAPREFHLVEAVAAEIVGAVLDNFPVGGVTVRVAKPSALASRNAKSAGVRIRRTGGAETP